MHQLDYGKHILAKASYKNVGESLTNHYNVLWFAGRLSFSPLHMFSRVKLPLTPGLL